jgi:predicted P-loop ATPase
MSDDPFDEKLRALGIDPETLTERPIRSNADKDWRSKLLRGDKKQPESYLANALIALRHAPDWQGVLGFDEFALQIMMLKPAAFVQKDKWQPCLWTDADDAHTAEWLQSHGIGVTENVAASAAETIAKENSFHPIKQYLRGVKWDGMQRIETFASVYLGAEQNKYVAEICKCFFVAAVARIARPGCKHDHVLILEGPQGLGKSRAVDALFSPWFSDDIAELGSKDSAMQVRVAWGIEIAELASMSRGEIERVKAFTTRRIDIFRPSYGRRVESVPRQSVFVGTTNADDYLKDETGGRRFWPIKCTSIDLAAIKRDRDQIWAEALSLYRKGHKWWLTEGDTIKLAVEEQANRFSEDIWQEWIASHIEGKSSVSVTEILAAMGMEKSKWSRAEQMRVARCLTALGWERYRTNRPPRSWCYKREGSATPADDFESEPQRGW